MPIRSFLEGEVFEPEITEIMGKALIAACKALGLRVQDDPATRLLASRIIEAARHGIHDLELLRAAALEGLGPAIKH